MTEEQKYRLVAKHPEFEVRRYEPHVVAEVTVPGPPDTAAQRAFRALVGYIGGRNRGSRSLAMTAPVTQQAAGRELAMTAPVLQHEAEGEFVVGFVMPSQETMETLPEPDDGRVSLRSVGPSFAAALPYSGRWTVQRYQTRLARLTEAVEAAGFRPNGPPQWSRFDPPWKPAFLRRNEVVLPIDAPGSAAHGSTSGG